MLCESVSESGIQKRNCSLLCIILRIRHRLRIWRNDKLINQLPSTALWIRISYYAAPCPNPGSENKIAHYYADPCLNPGSKKKTLPIIMRIWVRIRDPTTNLFLRIWHWLRIWWNDKLINQLPSTVLWIRIPYYAAPCPNPGSKNKIAHYYAYLGPDPVLPHELHHMD